MKLGYCDVGTRSARGAVVKAAAHISRGTSALQAEGTWAGGMIYGAIKHWCGRDPELRYVREAHTISLTLSGRSDLTGSRITGAELYEGRDGAGCLTFVPSGAERLGWYRNADLHFFVLLVDPAFVRLEDCGPEAGLQPFTNRCDALLKSVLTSLAGELSSAGTQVPSVYTEHAAGLVMAHLLGSRRRKRSPGSRARGLPQALLRRVLEFIEDHLGRDVSLSELASLTDMCTDVFARNFRAQMGVPPYRYVLERRMRRAMDLLIHKDTSVADIALAVGFSSQSHFTTQFSKLFGVGPAAYRRAHQA